jgi:TRAP-type C4-dicarboxylate transport system permease small subunit
VTEGKRIPGGRLPAKAALGMAILWTLCTLGFGFLALDGGVTGWQRAFQVVATAAGLFLAACYWFRYAQAKRNRG